MQRHYGRTMAFDIELQKRIDALTPAEISAALRRLVIAKISIVKGATSRRQAASSTDWTISVVGATLQGRQLWRG
jgi:hypothetical protein